MFCSRVAWVYDKFVDMYGRRLFSNVLEITERRDMGLYEVPLSMSLLGVGMGIMLVNFHMWYYVVVIIYFKHVR